MNHKITGAQGEVVAQDYLKDNGYTILECNYRNHVGELDIVAEGSSGVLLFVEVKTARTQVAGLPEEWVTAKKQKQIYKVAQVYCAQNQIEDREMRFDVVGVQLKEGREPCIHYYENAFIPCLN